MLVLVLMIFFLILLLILILILSLFVPDWLRTLKNVDRQNLSLRCETGCWIAASACQQTAWVHWGFATRPIRCRQRPKKRKNRRGGLPRRFSIW